MKECRLEFYSQRKFTTKHTRLVGDEWIAVIARYFLLFREYPMCDRLKAELWQRIQRFF